jgi:subtilisin family serine protease
VGALLQQNPDLPYSPIGVLVRFSPAASESARGQARAAIAGTLNTRYRLVPGLELIETELGVERALSILQRSPFVEYAEPDYIVELAGAPNDPSFSLQWGLENTGQVFGSGRNKDPGTAGADIGALEAWSVFTGNPDCVVAVVDTGMNYTHPDLAANIWTNPGEIPGNGIDDDGNGYIDDVHGWDFVDGDNDPMNVNSSHATHVAGIIGASGNNGVGVTGVNWQCKIMPLRAIADIGFAPVSAQVDAMEYAVAEGARVSNHSWGVTSFAQSLYDAMAAAGQQGHLVVASAGNDASDADVSRKYPACFDLDNVISVAATDNDDALASFSNWGALSVDLGAPGVNCYSTYWTTYGYMSGTSMAAPHVVGVAALLWGLHPEWNYAQVRDTLFATVRPVPSLQGITVTGGVVSASAAVGVPGAPSGLIVVKSGTAAVLTWQDNSVSEDGFGIERQKKSGKTWISTTSLAAPANATSFSDTPGPGTYRYRVRSWNSLATSDWTGWVSVLM